MVLIPKGGGDYCGIGLLEQVWKFIEQVIDHRLDTINLHDSLHGCHHNRGTGTTIIEVKLAQQLSYLELRPFYSVFLNLRKVFDAMDRERCLMVLEGYGAGPRMIRLISGFWHNAIMVCRAAGNYGTAFKASCGVTQGGPLLAKLFNIMVDTVVWEWFHQLWLGREYDNEMEFAEYITTFFTIFYVDDAYLASWDLDFLQYVLTHLVHLFECIGLQINTTKTQTIICTPGRIRTQLPTESYRQMRQGQVSASDWNSCNVECWQCRKVLKASSLGRHLADIHDIYQQAVVANELLEGRPPVLYTVRTELHDRALPCPYPGCNGRLRDGWMMRRHFRDVHLMDLIKVPKEGRFE